MRQRNNPLVVITILWIAVFASAAASAQDQRPEQSARTANIPPPQLLEILLRESEDVAIQALARSSVTARQLNAYSVRNSYTLLHFAIFHNRREFTRALLERDVNPNRVSPYTTALHEAAVYGNDYIANLLLEYGADVDAVDDNGDTPLTTAVRLNRSKLAYALLEHGARFDIENKWGDTPLAFAARSDAVDVVSHALESGVSPDIRIGTNERPLVIWAAEGGAARALNVLISSGANLDVTDAGGFRAIHEAAAAYGGAESVRVLLAEGANVGASHARTAWHPLHFAAASGSEETIGLLIESGANVDSRNAADRTPLHIAVASGRTDAVAALLDSGAAVSAQDVDARTPLHWAALSGDLESLHALLPVESDMAMRDRDGRTALDYIRRCEVISARDKNELLKKFMSASRAALRFSRLIEAIQSGNTRRVNIVLARDFENDSVEEFTGWTALHYAVAEGDPRSTALLVDRGMSPNVADYAGRTPLHIAAILRNRGIFDTLVDHGGDASMEDGAGITAADYFQIDPAVRPPMTYYGYVRSIHLETPASR